MTVFDLAAPLLSLLAPEAAHEVALMALEHGLFPRPQVPDPPSLATNFAGLDVRNPIGVAAGFDKDARVPDALLALGCGFAEVGTVTPRPQDGNPRPRLFRLTSDRALINRLGFNNAGHEAALARLRARTGGGVVGVNIGANRDSPDRIADYLAGLETFNEVASYVTINISSPNTPGLRDFESPAALGVLLAKLMTGRDALVAAGRPRCPIVVKISPDMSEADLAGVVQQCLEHGIDAMAVSNTTVSRTWLTDRAAREPGGLSGRPLFQRSTAMLARAYKLTEGRMPLIGIGGIDSGATALAKIEAGATLLQLYTGLVYEGPGLVQRIKEHLAGAVRRAGARSIRELTGAGADRWAATPLA